MSHSHELAPFLKKSDVEEGLPIQCGTMFVNIGSPWNPKWGYPTPNTYTPIPGASSRIYSYNRCLGMTHPGPPYSCGGGVSIWHAYDGGSQLSSPVDLVSGYSRYKGAFVCRFPLASVSGISDLARIGEEDFSEEASAAAAQYGAQAWNRYAPGKSLADAATFIAELRDVPRMLKTTAEWFYKGWKNFRSRSLANQWLNAQFGWLPFLSDMRKFANAYERADRMIQHIRKNNAVWRRYGGPVLSEEESGSLGGSSTMPAHYPTLPTGFYPAYPNMGNHEITYKFTRNVWFTGQFRYYIPDVYSDRWEASARRKLYGLNITPALVWEVTPWSWLIDWFINIQDVLENMDDGWAANLVSRMAFVMCTTRREWTVTSEANLLGGTHRAQWNYSLESKTRAAASPFGFGLSGDLSPRQTSILAAIGMSRR